MTRRRQRFSDEQIRDAIASNISYLAAIKALGDAPNGAAYQHLLSRVKQLEIDTSHFLGSAHMRDKIARNRVPLELIFTLQNVKSGRLRERLVKEGYLKKECSWCGITEWRGQSAPLELDHIDGDKTNNTLKNLRILCANCHSQTPTFRGRNIGKSGRRGPITAEASGLGPEG